MKRYFFFLFLAFSLFACAKKEQTAEHEGTPDVGSIPVAAQAAPESTPLAPPTPPSSGSPHPSGTPPPFMQQLAEYKARLEKNPKDIEAIVFLGNANFDIQRYEKAKEFYLRALEIDPNNHYIRTDLASSYRNLGDSDKALEELNKVLKTDPNHEVALYNVGVIYLNDKKDKEKASSAWRKIVQLKPNDPFSEELRKKLKELQETGSTSIR